MLLQPRVFDLLCYLVEHRDRVVSKEELLDTLWPGVVVTEFAAKGGQSRPVRALQRGRDGGAIRNYARRGCRFMPEEGRAADAPRGQAGLGSGGTASPRPYGRDAMRAFKEADKSSTGRRIPGTLGHRRAVRGDLTSAVGPLERAAVVYSSRGAREAAARVLIGLAGLQMESLDLAVAQGCLRRAERLLSGLPTGEQHGHLAWMTARLCLGKGSCRSHSACAGGSGHRPRTG